jgi:hypothetical protein
MTTEPHTLFSRRRSAPAGKRYLDYDLWTQRIAMALLSLSLIVFVLCPLVMILFRSVTNDAGQLVGFRHFVRYFSTPALLRSLLNTLIVGVCSMFGTVLLAFPHLRPDRNRDGGDPRGVPDGGARAGGRADAHGPPAV